MRNFFEWGGGGGSEGREGGENWSYCYILNGFV